MTDEERQEIHQRVKAVMADIGDHGRHEVKAPPQEEDLLDQELRATRLIYDCLDVFSVNARQRIIQHVMEFWAEQARSDRQALQEFAQAESVPYPQEAQEAMSRRR